MFGSGKGTIEGGGRFFVEGTTVAAMKPLVFLVTKPLVYLKNNSQWWYLDGGLAGRLMVAL